MDWGIGGVWRHGGALGLCELHAHPTDGTRLASGSDDSDGSGWGTGGRGCVKTLEGHSHCVTSVSFVPSGRRIASGGGDRTIRVVRGRHALLVSFRKA